MLTAYLDESYNQPTAKDPNPPLVYTVGCWLSTVEKWSKFGKQWKAELRAKGLDDFHMNRFESRIGEYADWSENERHGFFRRLKRIIKENTVYGVSVSVNCKDYDSLTTPALKRQWGKTYYGFDVRIIMLFLRQWADDNGYDGKIHYVFAQLPKQGGELDRIFTVFLKNQKLFHVSQSWTKSLMKDEVRLQAADVIAYEVNKRCVNHTIGTNQFVRKSLDIFQLDRNRFAPLYFGKPQLLNLFKSYRELIVQMFEN
jgi:hypothetical protein